MVPLLSEMCIKDSDQPAGQLQYWKNNGETPGQWDEKNTLVHDITTTELGVTPVSYTHLQPR